MDAVTTGRFPIPAATMAAPHCTEYIIRKSRFMAQSCHCTNPNEAREFIEKTRGQWRDATHNCWAFQLGAPGSTANIGSSDDGEPHGTAGKPILQALLHGKSGRICMVVTRWFGGIKLGTGGLVRAYQQSALANLESLPLIENLEWLKWRIVADYEYIDSLQRIFPLLEARVDNADYHEKAEFTVSVPKDRCAEFARSIANASNGRAIAEIYN